MRIRDAHRNVLREWKLLEILLFSRSLQPKSRRLPLSEGTAFLWRSNEPSLLSSYDVRSTINRNLFSLCRIERVSTCAFRILGMKMMGEASTTPLPNNVRVSRVFFSFFFLSLSPLFHFTPICMNEAVGSQGRIYPCLFSRTSSTSFVAHNFHPRFTLLFSNVLSFAL